MKKPWNIAHRGGADLRPENTMAAFSNAIAHGYDGAELDVQLSADGVVVVHHDFRLNTALTRQGGGWLKGQTPAIKDLSYAALQAYDVGRADPVSDYPHPQMIPVDGERIPSLEAVLAAAKAAPKPFALFVELKTSNDPASGDAIAVAEKTFAVMKDYLSHTIFVGFDWRGLLRVKELAPQAHCWFSTDKLEGDAKPILNGIAAARADGWFPDYRNASEENVVYARGLGLAVGAWTVDEAADMQRLVTLGLDAICTDRPDLLASLIAAA